MKKAKSYLVSLSDPEFVPSALKVAIVVGSLLFAINHGAEFLNRKMTRDRWISGVLTYFVPYVVNMHGQFTSRSRRS
ncbi:MAG TPA: nitrate/nitrite transporter NrtS [Oscillatoriales cyanobacterium M59_W2019_021]|nr:MAG: hypothetical protein D6728_00355 [Cyanobacteria bacterium J055]HIK32573.1 nitrate/nitrite transporter NrtS [Oscillatoriales cyanobacterium M4454_W2019_049]HIK52196.1 nitrate/nitrite transporter NrtS [Oscillatoriales cyanobacterium M59_W2019_021]